MFYERDSIRAKRGAEAVRQSNVTIMDASLAQVDELIDIVYEGLAALQSTDEPGSTADGAAIKRDHDTLQARHHALMARRRELVSGQPRPVPDKPGLYEKYVIFHADGASYDRELSEHEANSDENPPFDHLTNWTFRGPPLKGVFVLKPEKDEAARKALRAYAKFTTDRKLAAELDDWLGHLASGLCWKCGNELGRHFSGCEWKP